MSAVSLYRQYAEKYPLDPVPEKDFALLVSELRPAVDDDNESEPAPAPAPAPASARIEKKGDIAAIAMTPARAPLSEVRNDHVNIQNEIRDEPRDRNPQPISKCRELYSAWKNTTKNSTGTGTTKRKMDVLGWGFPE
jgi:hypothetical protein